MSSIMLISQFKNILKPNVNVIVRGRFHFFCLNRLQAKTIKKKLSLSCLLEFDRSFNGHFWSNALNIYIFIIRGWRSIRINFFVFKFSSFPGLTGFFQPSFWPKVDDLESWVTIPKASNKEYYLNPKFEE